MTALMRRQNAFTLIELTLVTIILLTLVGLSIPLFKRTFSDLSAKNTAFNISKLINYAQESAVIARKNFKLVFNLEKGSYQLFEVDASVNPPLLKKIRSRYGRLFSLPKELKFSGNRKEFVFYPDGHCDEIKINVLAKNRGYCVSVKRFGNMVGIQEVIIE